MKRNQIRPRHGYSLVELIAAFAVASIALTSTLSLYYYGMATTRAVEEEAVARRVIVNEMETLYAMPPGVVTLGEGQPFRSESAELHELVRPTATVSVTPWSGAAAGLKRVEVSVTWTGRTGHSKSRSMTTLLGDGP